MPDVADFMAVFAEIRELLEELRKDSLRQTELLEKLVGRTEPNMRTDIEKRTRVTGATDRR